MTPLENAEDPPAVLLYLLRYHMNPRIIAPKSKRATIVLMTGLATAPTCDFFDCGVVGCGVVVVVLNWMFCTGILHLVSPP